VIQWVTKNGAKDWKLCVSELKLNHSPNKTQRHWEVVLDPELKLEPYSQEDQLKMLTLFKYYYEEMQNGQSDNTNSYFVYLANHFDRGQNYCRQLIRQLLEVQAIKYRDQRISKSKLQNMKNTQVNKKFKNDPKFAAVGTKNVEINILANFTEEAIQSLKDSLLELIEQETIDDIES